MDINESPVEKWLSEYDNWFDRFDSIWIEEEKKLEKHDENDEYDDYDSDG